MCTCSTEESERNEMLSHVRKCWISLLSWHKASIRHVVMPDWTKNGHVVGILEDFSQEFPYGEKQRMKCIPFTITHHNSIFLLARMTKMLVFQFKKQFKYLFIHYWVSNGHPTMAQCLYFTSTWQQRASRPVIPSPGYASPLHNTISLI